MLRAGSLQVLLLGLLFLFCGAASVEAARFSTVIIDPGHGGRDKGAFWGGVRESRLNLQLAQRLEVLLKRRGIRTVMTRRSDVFVSLERRAAIANQYRSAVLVSLHYNATRNTSIRGAETYYWGKTGRTLATAIQRRLPAAMETRNRGVVRKGYTILMKTRCPAVLVEAGFMSNPRERAKCASPRYQQRVAQAICDGLMACR